jgi:hypothetical protein
MLCSVVEASSMEVDPEVSGHDDDCCGTGHIPHGLRDGGGSMVAYAHELA